MIDLGSLKIGVTVDKDSANKGLQEVNSNVDKADGKFKDLAKTVAGFGVAVGAVAGAMAMKLGKEVISAFGDYEQLVGGIDTLFKDSSEAMQGYAENAYKTAGMSANDYMETVTGFSASLISSLDGDTEKAVEYANMAITDMSDNANKMGSDIASIQNAYGGFAKQNYTMLDNLKLGYGGTKEEMQRLLEDATAISGITYDVSSYADVVDAIHVIQTEMDITGTTALEAEATISGSISTMSGAWQNWLVGLGNSEANMQELTSNLLDSFKNVVKNITPIIKNIADALPEAFGAMLPVIGELLPDLLSTVAGLFQNVLEMLLKILPQLIPVAVDAIMLIVDTLIDNLPLLIESAITLIMALTQGLMGALPQLIPAVIAVTILIVTELIKRIPEILEFVPVLFKELVKAFKEIDWMSLGSDLVKGIWDGIVSVGDWMKGKITGFVDGIKNLFTGKDGFDIQSPSKVMFGFGLNIVQGLANGIVDNENIVLTVLQSLTDKMVSVATDAVANVTRILSVGQMGQLTKDLKVLDDVEKKKKEKRLREELGDDKYEDLYSQGVDDNGLYTNSKVGVRELILESMKNYTKQGGNINDWEDTEHGQFWTDDKYTDRYKIRDDEFDAMKNQAKVTQNITVNSPKALSPSEVAKAVQKTAQKLVLGF